MDIESKIHSAEALCDEGKFDEARTLLAEVLAEDPNRSDVWRLAAQIDLNINKDVDKAYDELIEALRLDPKNLWALILMGNLLLGPRKDAETARSYFEKVLEYYPDNATALCNVGTSYAKQDEYADALIYYHSSLKADPNYTVAWFSMAACLYNMGEYQKAFDACMKGSSHYSRSPQDKDIEKKLTQVYFNAATRLVKAADYSSVRDKIISELQKVDHLPIRYKEDHSSHLSASMEYGPTHGRLELLIIFNPEKPFFDHLSVHELMHLKMMQQNTLAGKGKSFVQTPENEHAFMKRYYGFFKKEHGIIPQDKLKMVVSQMCQQASMQLVNCPLDLFVEDLIFQHYPELHPIQFLSLLDQERNDIEAGTNPLVVKALPPETVRVNRIMNMCTCMHFREMYSLDMLSLYHPTKAELEQATDLYEEYKAYVETFKTGDEYELVEYFGESLNMMDYFTIVDEKELTGKFEELKAEQKRQQHDEYADVQNARYALDHQDGADPQETMMMALYMEAAMEYCDRVGEAGTEKMAKECAMIGLRGINPNNKYVLHSLSEKEISGYQLIAFYYVGFARRYPEVLPKLGLPYSKAYD